MTDQYAELRAALAEGPMPGPWADDDGAIIQDVGSGSQVASVCGSTLEHHNAANARYIAAANPETITALLAERDELLTALEEGRRAIGEHSAPGDCYATGPLTGDPIRDLVQCPACTFITMYDAAIAKATGQAAIDLLDERDALAKDAEQLKELLEAANCCLEFSVADAFMRHKNQAGVCKEWAMLKRQLRAAMARREG